MAHDDKRTERERDRENDLRADERADKRADKRDRDLDSNPPRTTRGNMTAPKFGSAGSGGAELEPGPERD